MLIVCNQNEEKIIYARKFSIKNSKNIISKFKNNKCFFCFYLLSVLLIAPTASITISSNNLRTTTKPKVMKKSGNSSSMDNESLVASSDNRYRRLIPYMSFYVPTNDYNPYPINYVPMVRV